MSEIPPSHPRYISLITREKLVQAAHEGIVAYEGLTSHGRGEAFDYLLGEKTSPSGLNAEKLAARVLLAAKHPVLSINGNTAALAAKEIADLQKASDAEVEVNLFHRTDERVKQVSKVLEDAGCVLNKGIVERCIPLPHDRGLCDPRGIGSADVVLVPLEDGDRCEALVKMGKIVITIDLNPIDRTSRTATLPIVDEVRRALPNIAEECRKLKGTVCDMPTFDSRAILKEAIREMQEYLEHALD
ncbi:MAG TPA: 4-phosphopantoate--beta-alanine ligase [Methanocorpusculum sp.]|nr:4-phosphopantoate--beta-alanine ligase [Methanocorpusculum sp.]HJJ95579.1 4-phosphopantoate--beta-alanine ligase [Methanocorpusculum sp.]